MSSLARRTLGPRLLGAASIVAALAVLVAGCGTQTTSTDVWRDPSYVAGPVRNVIIFGGRMNETNRRMLEDGFVNALSSRGIRGTASYTLFPTTPLPDQPAARDAIQNGGYDGVLVSTMHGVKERMTVEPGVAYGGPFWGGYYGPAWGSAWGPGYVETDTFVKFETTLWDPHGNGKMIWSDVTQTTNPSSAPDFIQSLLKTVIPEMDKAGLLPPSPTGQPVSYAPATSVH
jgi:hypothetical protein